MRTLAGELGWDRHWGSPLESSIGGILGAPHGGVGVLLKKGWTSRLVPPNADDPVQQKLWTLGRWMRMCATLGGWGATARSTYKLCMASPTSGHRMKLSGNWFCVTPVGWAIPSQIILTDVNFNFDKPDRMPMAPLVALSDGWLVDADLLHSRLRGANCVSIFSKDGHTHTHTHTRARV